MDEPWASWGSLVWTQLWQVTLLIAGVWLILRLIGRDRPHLACALWLVVLLKCLTPPLVSSPSGIFCWLQREDSAAGKTALAIAASGPAVEQNGDAIVVQALPIAALPAPRSALPAPLDSTSDQGEPHQVFHSWLLLRLAVPWAWLAGAVFFAVVALIRWRACWRKLCDSRQIAAADLVALVEELRHRLALRRKVRLWVTESSLGPAVIGIWRPIVILPAAIVRDKSPPELAPLVAHELIHIRRGDLWIGMLQMIAVALWWFHPLVRLASRMVTREAERCCDEETIAHLGCDPAKYARSLIDVLALKNQLSPIPAFPGVRPVDVTSQRLERIMKLGQGCHKRTPWWCWLVMLAAAAAVLPGAALVLGAKEKPKPQPKDPEQYIRPDFQLTEEADDKSPELATRTYDAADLLAAIASESGDPEDAVRLLLTTLVQSAAPGPWEQNQDAPGRYTGWDEDKLVVRQTEEGHQRIAEQLAVLREHGNAQIAVEVRITTGPMAVFHAEGIPWRMLGDRAAPSVDKPRHRSFLSPSGTVQSRVFVEEEPSLDNFRGTATAVIERNVPALVALVNEKQVTKLLESAQADPRTNVLQAPKVTLFNGQSARVEDAVQWPFVVGVTPLPDGQSTTLKPTIRLYSEGTAIRLRPVAHKDGTIRLDFGLTLSQIRDVETAEFSTGPGKEPITVQVPEVASIRLNTSVEMSDTQTLMLSIPKTGKGKKEQQPMCVLVTVRKLAQNKERASQPSAAQEAAEAARADGVFRFEAHGWRFRTFGDDWGPISSEKAGGMSILRHVAISGHAKFEAVQQSSGDRIIGQAQTLEISQPATSESRAQLAMHLAGDVRLIHNESRMEAKKILLRFESTDEQPASVAIQIDDGRVIKMPGTSDRTGGMPAKADNPATSDDRLISKVYPVADLVIPVPTGPIKISPTGQYIQRESPAQVKPDFGTLTELITTTIHPDSWEQAGGQGRICTANDHLSLVIRQEAPIHTQINSLLHQLRRLQDIQVVLKLERLEVSAADLENVAAQEADSPLGPVAQDQRSRAWCLKPGSIATLKGLPGARLQTGPKVTTFNGQSVDLRLVVGERRDDLLTRLVIQPLVTADFRSLQLQFFGDMTPSADGAADNPRTVLDLAIAKDSSPRSLPMERRELVLGQVLVVDESQFAWQERAPAKKPKIRHFYLITPQVLITTEEETGRVAAPQQD